jgi:hypothetical protein
MPPDRVGPSARRWSGPDQLGFGRSAHTHNRKSTHLCDPVHTESYFQLRARRVQMSCPASPYPEPCSRSAQPAASKRAGIWLFLGRADVHSSGAGPLESRIPNAAHSAFHAWRSRRPLLISTSGMSLPAPIMTSASPAERHKFIIILILRQCPHRCHSECRMDILSHHVTYTFALAISTIGGGPTGGPAGMTSQLSSE